MNVTFRPIVADELMAYALADAAGFGEGTKWIERAMPWISSSIDRTLAGFDGEDIVTTGRNYPFELTVPGGGIMRAAGVSAVTVLPTHRRRGFLRQMMAMLLDDAVAREEPVSMLTASEASIYARFGFGISTRSSHARIDTREVEFSLPRPEGRLRLVSEDEARKVEPDVFDRVRRAYPGAISRPDEWWGEQLDPEFGTRFDVLYESPAGTLDGYAAYAIKDRWEASGAAHRLHARDVVAATPDAVHALWRYLTEIDLVRTIEVENLPVDSALPWMLTNARAVRPEPHDFVWTRLLDAPAALGARTYAVPGRLVLELHDPFRPGGAADGTFALDGGPDGAAVTRSDATADLVCGVDAASAAWLGGVRWSQLAAAGAVEERTDGALARADLMFASTPLPFPFTWF